MKHTLTGGAPLHTLGSIDNTARVESGDSLLTSEQLEAKFGMARGWAAKDRLRGGVPYIKLGRAVRYRLADVQNYLEQKLRHSTSEMP